MVEKKLLREAYYPSYMVFSPDELKGIFESFFNILKSVWQSVKLLISTLKLNFKVVAGTIAGNQTDIRNAFETYQTERREYDREMSKNLKYFKKHYMDSELGGAGPKVLAFMINPFAFAAGQVSSATVGRGTGELSPYDVDSPIRSMIGMNVDNDPDGSGRRTKTEPVVQPRVAASSRVKRALDFFEYDASLNEAAQAAPVVSSEAQREVSRMREMAVDYVDAEQRRAANLLGQISGAADSLREITESKNFNELIVALKNSERRGFKISVTAVETANREIRSEFQSQREKSPEEFKKTVKMMRQKSPDIKEKDDLEAAMTFVFGISKSGVQSQLINLQQNFMNEAKTAMNIPVDDATRAQLSSSELGRKYLGILDSFERALSTGQRQAEFAKRSLKS